MSKVVKVTMGEIAVRAGVSQATVSLVLNKSRTIKLSDVTRERVLTIAREMGYTHKSASNACYQKKIALIVNGLSSLDPFIEAINSARRIAWNNNWLMSIFEHEHEAGYEDALKKEILSGGYKGVIHASSMTRHISSLNIKAPIPIVYLNGYSSGREPVTSILPADEPGAYKATCHLLAQGYRNIAILTGETWMEATDARCRGYHRALKEYGVAVIREYEQITNWSMSESCRKTQYLLGLKARPQAFFCCSDYIALGCYQAILSQGLKIPSDVALMGYDNQRFAAELTPSLSTVELPYGQMGEMAVNLLLKLIDNQAIPCLNLRVEGELIIRQSSLREK